MLPNINEALRYLGAGSHPPEELSRPAAAGAEELAGRISAIVLIGLLTLISKKKPPKKNNRP